MSSEGSTVPEAAFHTTRWSIVLSAGRSEDEGARAALETLCQTYWYPLYAFARRKGADSHAASDRVQGFFARLLEKRDFEAADPERGRFRAFLLTAFKHYCANLHDREVAQKRGGGRAPLALDLTAAEGRYQAVDPALSPERMFDRAWALALLDEVLFGLRKDYEARGRGELFEAIKDTLTALRGTEPYAEIAARLDMTEGALKVAVHRLRERYKEGLLAAVAGTLEQPADVQAELAILFEALGG